MNQNIFCTLPRFFIVLNYLFGTVVFFSLFLFPFAIDAQNPTLVWAKTYGGSKQDYANSIVVTKDNKYLIVGSTFSFDGNIDSIRGLSADVWLLKLDSNGNILWKKNYGGSSGETMFAITQTTDNGFIMVGATGSSDGDVTTVNRGLSDCWVIKIDSLGTIQWQKTIGGSKSESLWSVFQTQNGDYIMGGYSDSNDLDFSENSGLYDMWILKLNSQGNLIWKKRLGGSKDDFLAQITNIDDKTFAIAARTDSRDGDMAGSLGDFSVKMDSSGKVIWKKSFGYYNELAGLKEFHAITMSQKNIVSVGMKIVTRAALPPRLSYSWDFLITKSDTAGNHLWSKYFGGTETERATSVLALPNGDLLVSGYAQSDDVDVVGSQGDIDFWIVRMDSLGNLKNANCYGGSQEDKISASAIDKEGNLVFVGYSTSSNGIFPQNRGSYDFAVIKLKYNLTSTKESEIVEDILAYPNPVDDELILKVPPNVNPIFRLYDVAGKLMYQSKTDEIVTTIDMHNLPKGFYIISYSFNGTRRTKKICKM
jgi:Secretion system C-terminal sorting domain